MELVIIQETRVDGYWYTLAENSIELLMKNKHTSIAKGVFVGFDTECDWSTYMGTDIRLRQIPAILAGVGEHTLNDISVTTITYKDSNGGVLKKVSLNIRAL